MAGNPGARRRLRLGVLCGGPSAEHRISLLSSRHIVEGARDAGFEAVCIGVDMAGRWLLYGAADHLVAADDPRTVALAPGGRPVVAAPAAAGGQLRPLDGRGAAVALDVVFPVMHGPYGEDGKVQALLEAARIPYVGCGVTASALCMDKDHTKAVLRAAGLPVVEWVAIRRDETERAAPERLRDRLGAPPYFVKPANLGSSVGISRVDRLDAIGPALALAFAHDRKVLIERAVRGRELECALLGNERPEASGVAEIVVRGRHRFYSYEAKYLDEAGAALRLAADLDATVRERIRTLAVAAFRVLGCRGLARADFFLSDRGEIFLNELNTMPGFTRISMFPKLWEREELTIGPLVARLVELALADRPAGEATEPAREPQAAVTP